MMSRAVAAVLLAAIGHCAGGRALAADARYPDWPCNQIKVPELSVAAVWAGPPLDDVGDRWEADADVRDLVARLAERRTPLEEAETAIADFITGTSAEKLDKARLLFAGLFDTLNRQRSEVMSAIERFTRRQKELAAKVRGEAVGLRELRDAPNTDQTRVDEAANEIAWNTRIFEDRRKTIGYVCEVPVIIERRLFALSQAVAQRLD
ncbi:MAG: hypothetical protein ABSG76_03545 [Xanthobacteraceae bacterium]|jgi:hypothetical protein